MQKGSVSLVDYRGVKMSLRTRINGLTAWVNLRLRPFDQLMNNVVMDLLTGTNMKMLLQSMTGRDLKKMKNLDG